MLLLPRYKQGPLLVESGASQPSERRLRIEIEPVLQHVTIEVGDLEGLNKVHITHQLGLATDR